MSFMSVCTNLTHSPDGTYTSEVPVSIIAVFIVENVKAEGVWSANVLSGPILNPSMLTCQKNDDCRLRY